MSDTDLKTPWAVDDWETMNGPMSTINNSDGKLLATVASDEYGNGLDDVGVSRVAKLMAGALEMYEALAGLARHAIIETPEGDGEMCLICGSESGPDCGETLQHQAECPVGIAEAALAKARGAV